MQTAIRKHSLWVVMGVVIVSTLATSQVKAENSWNWKHGAAGLAISGVVLWSAYKVTNYLLTDPVKRALDITTQQYATEIEIVRSGFKNKNALSEDNLNLLAEQAIKRASFEAYVNEFREISQGIQYVHNTLKESSPLRQEFWELGVDLSGLIDQLNGHKSFFELHELLHNLENLENRIQRSHCENLVQLLQHALHNADVYNKTNLYERAQACLRVLKESLMR